MSYEKCTIFVKKKINQENLLYVYITFYTAAADDWLG